LTLSPKGDSAEGDPHAAAIGGCSKLKEQGSSPNDSSGQSLEPNEIKPQSTRSLPFIAPMVETNAAVTWMADTGASVDVIDGNMISDIGMTKVKALDKASVYATPGGDVVLDSKIQLHSKSVGKIDASIVDGSPNVISIGRRCMISGFGFYWPPFQSPYLITPDRKRKIRCTIENYVPFVCKTSGVICPLTEGGSSSSGVQRPASSGVPDQGSSVMMSKDFAKAVNPAGQKGPAAEVKDEVPENYQDPDDIPLLKLEAQSLHHQLTHLPKNPYCQACQRAKLQRKPNKKRNLHLENGLTPKTLLTL